LYRQGLSLQVKPSAKKYLLDKGYDIAYGARPMRRAVQDELEHLVADGLLGERFTKGDVLVAAHKKDALVVTQQHE